MAMVHGPSSFTWVNLPPDPEYVHHDASRPHFSAEQLHELKLRLKLDHTDKIANRRDWTAGDALEVIVLWVGEGNVPSC